MHGSYYWITQIMVILIALGLLASILLALNYVLKRMFIPIEKRRKLLGLVGLGFSLWLTLLTTLANVGFFQNFEVLPPRILLAVIPCIVLIIALLFSRFMRVALKIIPAPWLLGIQSFSYQAGFWDIETD